MKMINKKSLFLAMGILVLIVVGFFYFQNENEKKEERKVLENFVKEHNASVEEKNYKIDRTNLGEDIQKISFKTDENKSEEKGEELKPLIQEKEISFENREIKPYTEPLPEMPDEEISKEMFVDENQNGVRDDIEIPIVKEFGSDRDLVEAFFAAARVHKKILYFVENELLDDKNIQKSLDYFDMSYECANKLLKLDEQKKYNPNFVNIYSKYFEEKSVFYNTEKRQNDYKKFNKQTGGFAFGSNPSRQECNSFFKKTKSWNFD